MNKILLYIKIRKFYNTFGEVLNSHFITKLSDMTADNLQDVLFDIQEVLGAYDDETEPMTIWLRALFAQIHKFHYHLEFPLTLNTILFNICNKKVNGFHERRPHTELIQWLYKKGVR